MRSVLFALIILFSCLAEAKPRATHLSLELSRMPHNRDFLFPGKEDWGHELQLRWSVDWWRWFADNNVTGRTADSRFRYVGWEYETGFHIVEGLDLVWHHHSQHAIDWYRERFPVVDAYGIRMTFIDEKR